MKQEAEDQAPSCAQLPLASPAGAGARRRSNSTRITDSYLFPFLFSQSLSQPNFCCVLFFVRLDLTEYVALQL